MKAALLFLIKVYQRAISPYLGCQCKFFPSCSAYAAAAIKKYGVIKGTVKTIVRIAKCNPFTKGYHIDFP